MMKIFILLVLLAPSAWADSIVIYSTTTNRCLSYLPSQDPSFYQSRVDVMIFNDTTAQTETQVSVLVATTTIRYFKKIGNPQITEMNATEKAAVEADLKSNRIIGSRISAIAEMLTIGSQFARDRAIVIAIKDEINLIRQWLTSFKVEVSSSTSLADLKKRVSTLPNMPDRTTAQAKSALNDIITSGEADK